MDPSPRGRPLAHGFLCQSDQIAATAEYIKTVDQLLTTQAKKIAVTAEYVKIVDQLLTIAAKKYDVLKAMVCLERDLNFGRFSVELELVRIRAQRRRRRRRQQRWPRHRPGVVIQQRWHHFFCALR